MKTLQRVVVLVLGLSCLVQATLATAQITGPPTPITPDLGFIGQYEALRSVWFFTLFPLATALFWKLATLEIVLSGVLWVSSQQSFDLITGHLFRKIFWIGFSYAVLLYADTWIPAVIDSFSMVGLRASGLAQLSPGSIFAQGLALAVRILYTMSFLGILENIVEAVVGIFAALAIAVAHTLIAIEMAVTLVESYVVTGAGVFLLGFAAFRGTSGITERYLGYTIAVGLRLFVIHLLVGAGAQLAQRWAAYINETTIFDLAPPLSIAGSALLFTLLTWRIPKLAGALASGVTSLGLYDVFGVAGGAVRFAAMAAPAGQIAAGTMTIAHAASQGAGGGVRGALSGIRAAGGTLSREISAASVPRLHQAARRVSAQADTVRRPSADTFGLSLRSVKAARRHVVAIELVRAVPTSRLVRNRLGVKMVVNLHWVGPRLTQMPVHVRATCDTATTHGSAVVMAAVVRRAHETGHEARQPALLPLPTRPLCSTRLLPDARRHVAAPPSATDHHCASPVRKAPHLLAPPLLSDVHRPAPLMATHKLFCEEENNQNPTCSGPPGRLSALVKHVQAEIKAGRLPRCEEPRIEHRAATVRAQRQPTAEPQRVTPPPNLQHITLQDLREMERLLCLYQHAVDRGWIGSAEADRLTFVALAQHVLLYRPHNPGGLFHRLLTKRLFHYVTQEDEDQALMRLKAYDRGHGFRRFPGTERTIRRAS